MRIGFNFIIGTVYLAFTVGFLLAKIGEPTAATKILGWLDAFWVFAAIAIPFYLGFMAGRESKE